MIQINPLQSYIDGGARAAITSPPSASLVFDLPGKAIWVKGVKLKGTDHTYTFSHDNYITLTNTPGSSESEDILIGVDITLLKSEIDITYTTGTLAQLRTGTSTAALVWTAEILAQYIREVLPTTFTGATSSANGTAGLVKLPLIADRDKFLKGDGTWAVVNPDISSWTIEVNKASFSITQLWTDSEVDLSTLSQGVCLLHINYQNVHYSGIFTYYGQSINTDDEIVLHQSGTVSLDRGRIFAKIAPISGTTKLLLAGATPETNISLFNIKIKQIAIL